MDLITQINRPSAMTIASPGFRLAKLASIDGMRPDYTAQAPHIPVTRRVSLPSILGNNSPVRFLNRTDLPCSAELLSRMDGGFPEYAADMKSTLG